MTNLIGFNFSKRTNKRAVDAVAVQEKAEDPLREEVVGISENELQSAATSVPVPKPVIPNLPNTFQVRDVAAQCLSLQHSRSHARV
jgi:hypothetical protein